MNIYQRHGDRIRIATAADFYGTHWTITAVMTPTPIGVSYLTPAGSIARLFRKHTGTHGVELKTAPASLDVAASRAGNKLFLHVVNTQYDRSVDASFPEPRAAESSRSHLKTPCSLSVSSSQTPSGQARPS